MKKRRIYTLDNLPPEVKAVTFAKTSRSPKPFDEIASELTAEKSSEFHERWVVGYGHSSVAEHAVLSIAIENVSNLASKVIEDNRLASYTEKSSRYQVFKEFYQPPEFKDVRLLKLFIQTAQVLVATYNQLYPQMYDFIAKKYPQDKKTPQMLYQAMTKGRACDNLRLMLPAAIYTNIGVTINARSLEHAITKLLSHPLQEMQEIGQEIKEAAAKITPTLIKYAQGNDYLIATEKRLKFLADSYFKTDRPDSHTPVVLVDYDRQAKEKIVAALLYKHTQLPYKQVLGKIKSWGKAEKEKIIEEALKHRGNHDQPLREFEHAYYTFDILVDYGAFRDIQRHRMCTQTNQLLTCDHGFVMPEEIAEAGMSKEYQKVIRQAEAVYYQLKEKYPEAASYIVPLAFRKRVLITWNLRELHHFIPLRSSQQGHPSYRRIAQQVWEEINKVQPFLAKFIQVDKTEAIPPRVIKLSKGDEGYQE